MFRYVIRYGLLIIIGILYIGTVLMWVRSHSIVDSCQLALRNTYYIGTLSYRGGITVSFNSSSNTLTERFVTFSKQVEYLEAQFFFLKKTELLSEPASFGYGRISKAWSDGSFLKRVSLRSPYWFVFLLLTFCVSCYSWFWIYRPYSRLRSGKCLSCGYNLHGLTEPRCPECGTPFDPMRQDFQNFRAGIARL